MESTLEIKKKFATVMWGVAEEWGGKISKSGLEMRFLSLKKYSIDQITQAGSWLLENRKEKYPAVPTTKEFIDAIRSAQGELVDPKMKAQSQCDIVFKYFDYYGSHCDHRFKDSITRYLMENRWSFRKLGVMRVDDLKWFRKEFVEAYQDCSREEPAVKNLIGCLKDGERISSKRLQILVPAKRMDE